MGQLSALIPVGVILYIFVLLANTGWLGMALLGLAFDTSRETRRESHRGTDVRIALSAVAEVILVVIAGLAISYYWSNLSVW